MFIAYCEACRNHLSIAGVDSASAASEAELYHYTCHNPGCVLFRKPVELPAFETEPRKVDALAYLLGTSAALVVHDPTLPTVDIVCATEGCGGGRAVRVHVKRGPVVDICVKCKERAPSHQGGERAAEEDDEEGRRGS